MQQQVKFICNDCTLQYRKNSGRSWTRVIYDSLTDAHNHLMSNPSHEIEAFIEHEEIEED